MIIGVCGTFASGKDSAAEYIAERLGHLHISTGDLVRQYVRENDLGGIDRDNLWKVANGLRAKHGSGFLITSSLKKYADNVVFSGIRSPGELEAVHQAGGMMIAVDAPIDRRYQWAKSRGRIGDEITAEYFRQQEAAEENRDDPNKQQLTTVISLSDFDIANDGTLEELHAKIDDVLMRLKPRVKSQE
jgi:dephospho-CoA kinase